VKFGEVPLAAAAGCVLAHSARLSSGVVKKGTVLGTVELQRFAADGLKSVVVARVDSTDVPENEAAEQVARVLCGAQAETSSAATGRVNLYATRAGLLLLDAARVHAANRVHEGLTIATLQPDSPVAIGQMLATVKIIPYAVPGAALQQVLQALNGATSALQVAPWRAIPVALLLTRTRETSAAMLEKMRAAVNARLLPLGATLVAEETVAHEEQPVAAALAQLLDHAAAPQLLLVSGAAATVDRQDVIPAAVVRAGGMVLHAGMPVDPGNLLVLADLPRGSDRCTVVGIPTCARSPKLNGFDFVLRRLVAGQPVAAADIMAMGVGGLLTEIDTRPMPRDPRQLRT
jgi:molybdenum cofactor cytidylyltransferase